MTLDRAAGAYVVVHSFRLARSLRKTLTQGDPVFRDHRWCSTNIKPADSRYDRGTSGGQVIRPATAQTRAAMSTCGAQMGYRIVTLRGGTDFLAAHSPDTRKENPRYLPGFAADLIVARRLVPGEEAQG